jgi:hypothetical protein
MWSVPVTTLFCYIILRCEASGDGRQAAGLIYKDIPSLEGWVLMALLRTSLPEPGPKAINFTPFSDLPSRRYLVNFVTS